MEIDQNELECMRGLHGYLHIRPRPEVNQILYHTRSAAEAFSELRSIEQNSHRRRP
jgi:hypothetical protein